MKTLIKILCLSVLWFSCESESFVFEVQHTGLAINQARITLNSNGEKYTQYKGGNGEFFDKTIFKKIQIGSNKMISIDFAVQNGFGAWTSTPREYIYLDTLKLYENNKYLVWSRKSFDMVKITK